MAEKMISSKRVPKEKIEEALINNFINLQKVLTNLSFKFEELSNNISKLLELFELAAKSFADKHGKQSSIDQDFLKKLDALLEQNKTISKGIMMMEERVKGRTSLQPTYQPSVPYKGFTRPAPG